MSVAFAPASLSNLGPGFDALGLAITGAGDRVAATRTDAPGVTVTSIAWDGALGGGTAALPTDPAHNTAARAAAHVLRLAGATGGLALTLDKGIPLGSGIGGSAASAVAGAVAADAALGAGLDAAALLAAALDGEAAVSGAAHADNVAPALLGGLVLVDPADPTSVRRLVTPDWPPLVVVLPAATVLTRDARAVLPATVPRADAAAQAASLAFLLDALAAGDWAAAGRRMETDRLAEPHRAPLVPVYAAVCAAARAAGAAGVCLSGSGPALVALAPRRPDAVLAVMADAAGPGARAWIARADGGARLVDA